VIDINLLTIGQAREIAQMFAAAMPQVQPQINNGMIGKYVIVRCRDAGVHAGVLEAYIGRECVLNDARRLWYWKPANGGAFLSGVAVEGLHPDSKIGAPIRVHLTENCEIIECSNVATRSIKEAKTYAP
jgi:hypothetical protein